MAVSAASFLTHISRELQDETRVRWSLEDLVGYLNDGQMYICTKVPHALCAWQQLTLVAGTRQSVPATCLGVLEIVRNVAGRMRAITQLAREDLNAMAPDWGSAKAGAHILHYTQDAREPRFFEVFPQATAGTKVQALMALKPTAVGAGASGNVSLDEEWHEALRQYVLYRAWSMDAEFASNANLAAAHLQACHEALGVLPARPATKDDPSQ